MQVVLEFSVKTLILTSRTGPTETYPSLTSKVV